jgi:predicted cupin superfamily sugar epimerase
MINFQMNTHKKNAEYWISRLGLEAHPEGGYFSEYYRSTESIPESCLPKRFKTSHVFSTAIYFLLTNKQCSKFHKIKSDELWHFYQGDRLILFVLNEKGILETIFIGSDYEKGESFQAVIPAGCWMAAKVEEEGEYSLLGCTVAPGFEFVDFEMANRDYLIEKFPEHKVIIDQFV